MYHLKVSVTEHIMASGDLIMLVPFTKETEKIYQTYALIAKQIMRDKKLVESLVGKQFGHACFEQQAKAN